MKKGIFWCVDTSLLQPRLITVSVSCNANGDADPSAVFSSKSGENFNHKAEWEKLDKTIRNGVAYNYYPRGRVEVKNGKATIYLNPDINRGHILRAIREAFELTNPEELAEIAVKSDGSRHYHSASYDDIIEP